MVNRFLITCDDIRKEISEVTITIRKLNEFRSENILNCRLNCSHTMIELKTFMKHGIRYRQKYYAYEAEGISGKVLRATKTYKSISRLVHDLKIYRNELQSRYSYFKKLGEKNVENKA